VQDNLSPVLCADIVVERQLANGQRSLLLVERKWPPFGWALPGGHVDSGESVERTTSAVATCRPMRGPSSRRPELGSRWFGAFAFLAIYLGVQGCTTSNNTGGVWRAQAPLQGETNAILFEPGGQPVGIELVLGEFGPDLSGLVRYYRAGPTGPFDQPRRAAAPDFECACAYLHDGRIDSTGLVTFTLQACAPGVQAKGKIRLRGRFMIQADGRLVGKLQVDSPGSSADGSSVDLAFERALPSGDVDPRDLQCAQPLDAEHGNVDSGR